MKAGNVARGAPLAGGVSMHSPQGPRKGAGEQNKKVALETSLGIAASRKRLRTHPQRLDTRCQQLPLDLLMRVA